jgi:hypothetical protein
MNSFGDMCKNRILNLTPFLPQRVKWVIFYGVLSYLWMLAVMCMKSVTVWFAVL